MPSPMENKSLVNSTEEFREIQPSMDEEEKMVDYGSPALHIELARILKRMVSESLSTTKPPDQQNIQILSSYEMVVAGSAKHNPGKRNRGRPPLSTLVKEFAVSFKLPNNCIAKDLDMDKVALSYRNSSVPNGKGKIISDPQFSFMERLEGWIIQCRQRQSNIYDTFYRHIKADRSFRSIVEVVRFMLYEIYPISRKEYKGRPANIQHKHMTAANEPPMINREMKPTSGGDNKEEQEEMYYKMMVKKFFKNSHGNLMDFESDDVDTDNEEDEVRKPEIYYQEISSDEEKNKEGPGSETVEEMLETMYDGLRNISSQNMKRMMSKNNQDEQRDGVKKPRTEKRSDNIQIPQYNYTAAQEETKQQKKDRELDELAVAEVLLSLRTARSASVFPKISKGVYGANNLHGNYYLKHHVPASKSVHKPAQFPLKTAGQACRCPCTCRSTAHNSK